MYFMDLIVCINISTTIKDVISQLSPVSILKAEQVDALWSFLCDIYGFLLIPFGISSNQVLYL